MTLNYFLPHNSLHGNIHLNIADEYHNISYNFRTSLKISPEDWNQKKQRPCNIYLKKFKILNRKLDQIKLQLIESNTFRKEQRIINVKRKLAKQVKVSCTMHNEKLPENSLLYFMQWYIDYRKEMICKSTYLRYKVFLI